MASGTGAAAEVLSESAYQRGSVAELPAVQSASDFHRCFSELQLLLHRNELGVRFFFEDRAGRLRSAHRYGRTIDLGRRQMVLRRESLSDGRTRLLEGEGERLVGLFPINRFGSVVGVVEVSTTGRSLLRRRLAVEAAVGRLSERLQRDAELERERQDLDIGLAWVAHELRGPLLAARLSLENTADGLGATDARSIFRAADELTQLAARLDSILHLLVGNGTIRRRQVDVVAVVRDAAGCCVAASGDDRVVIEGRSDRLTMVADPLHLRSAIENLIGNALRYSTPGTTVVVTTEPRGDHIVVEVQNEGSGIRPDHRERIFEPLVRGRSGAGTGLGLFVARRVIERHGGTIRYHEPRDGLSVFELRLPTKGAA
jgi:signal transduction histidine kinase